MKRRRKKKLRLFPILLILCLLYTAWQWYKNTDPVLTSYTVSSREVPAGFDGFRILQVSDLHDALCGKDNKKLISLAAKACPDIIVITGDFIDSNRLDIERSLNAAKSLAAIAPVYYVSGNHEAALSRNNYHTLTKGLKDIGVTVLEDDSSYITRGADRLQVLGLQDIGFYYSGSMEKTRAQLRDTSLLLNDPYVFTVTLSHRPELISTYAQARTELVLCGHAHGGQFRIPFVGGLYSPGQGLLPKHTSGIYREGNTSMLVSRGIGNSKFPLRVNNPPELVLITLKHI